MPGSRPAVVVGYIHNMTGFTADRGMVDQAMQLFGLTPSEAHLTLALSHTSSIGEAAHRVGLSVATARNYTKQIYAKVGARGHPDLVRIVLTSVAALGM